MHKQTMTLMAILVLAGTASPALAGAVTGVTVSPATVRVGGTVSVTVTGTNPCGAAHIIYSDDAAITYAIYGLPTTQTHVYDKAGTYTITAKGMGNCEGEARTSVTVTAPEPPAVPHAPTPGSAEITSVEISPKPGRMQEPVTISVNGTGTCAYDVEFGDGNTQGLNGRFPQQLRHTYSRAANYTVVVRPTAPCSGRFTQVLQVVDAATVTPRIARVVLSPSPAVAEQPVNITIEGSGACRGYTLDYGDGNSEPRAATLPDRTRHVYPAPGRYVVAAIANASCTGDARASLEVRSKPAAAAPHIARVDVSPAAATAGQPVTITIAGTGACRGYTVDYGDGNTEPRAATLPDRTQHVYGAPGRYVIVVIANDTCTGEGRATIDVRRRRR